MNKKSFSSDMWSTNVVQIKGIIKDEIISTIEIMLVCEKCQVVIYWGFKFDIIYTPFGKHI